MSITCLIPPVKEPVSLEAVKTFLRLTHDEDDAMLTASIKTGREIIENYTGRTLIEQKMQIKKTIHSCHMSDSCFRYQLPHAPLLKIDCVTLGDQTIPTHSYSIVESGGSSVLEMHSLWRSGGLLTVTYWAGYGDEPDHVPYPIKRAIMLIVRHLYEGRSDIEINPLSFVYWLVQSYRLVGLS